MCIRYWHRLRWLAPQECLIPHQTEQVRVLVGTALWSLSCSSSGWALEPGVYQPPPFLGTLAGGEGAGERRVGEREDSAHHPRPVTLPPHTCSPDPIVSLNFYAFFENHERKVDVTCTHGWRVGPPSWRVGVKGTVGHPAAPSPPRRRPLGIGPGPCAGRAPPSPSRPRNGLRWALSAGSGQGWPLSLFWALDLRPRNTPHNPAPICDTGQYAPI